MYDCVCMFLYVLQVFTCPHECVGTLHVDVLYMLVHLK